MEYGGPDPSAVLASGTYTVIAKNREKIYQQDITVAPGEDALIELVADPLTAQQSQ